MEIKTTGEQLDSLYKVCGEKELLLGQYARKEIPLTELMTFIHNDKKKWVSVDSLLRLSSKELIEEVRKLHIQRKRELEKDNEI